MQKAEKNKLKSRFSLFCRVGIAAVACWIIVKDLDFAQLGRTFERLHFWVLLVAIVTYGIGQCMVGFRWWLVLRAQGIRIPLVLALRLTFVGQFFSQFMPSSVGGDLVRAWYISRHSENKKLQAALGVAVDRMVGLISTFLLAFSSYLLFMRGQDILRITPKAADGRVWQIEPDYLIPLLLSAAFIIAGVVTILLASKTFKAVALRLFRHTSHFFSQFWQVLRVYYHHPALFLICIILTLILQAAIIVSYWGIGKDLDIAMPVGYYLVFFPMVWAFGSIPISIAGIGILEGGVVFLFVKFGGCDPETAMTLALCQRLTWVLSSIPGLWFHLSGTYRSKSD
ncbi:MAG: flippase-like domain-containing protein [Planctomycetaceae bacterium]|nr:flippase-like domain-containing protein [Planctomycetaceae bacterium]